MPHAEAKDVPGKIPCKEVPGWKFDGACQRSKAENVGILIAQECVPEKLHGLQCTAITRTEEGGIYAFTFTQKIDWAVKTRVEYVTIVLSPARGENVVTDICGPRYAFCVEAKMKVLVTPQK